MKYLSSLRNLIDNPESKYSGAKTSLLFVAVAEQWPFFVDRHPAQEVEHCAQWVARYLGAAARAGENKGALLRVRDALVRHSISKHTQSAIRAAFDDQGAGSSSVYPSSATQDPSATGDDLTRLLDGTFNDASALRLELDELLRPPLDATDHPALHRWQKQDIADAIEEGSLGRLMLCLCSSREEVRRQALVNIRLCMSRMQGSRQSDWEQIYLLMGELAETARGAIDTNELSSFAVVLASHSVSVLSNPRHAMFSKLNKFLNKGPSWDMPRLPSFWIDKILHQPPEKNDDHNQESEWLLDVLVEGLRTPKVRIT